MATFTFTINNSVVNRVLDAIASDEGYTGFDSQGNPQTKSEFFKFYIGKHVKRKVKEYEGGNASVAAINAANTDVENNIIIT